MTLRIRFELTITGQAGGSTAGLRVEQLAGEVA